MHEIATVLSHPLVAIGVAGFLVLTLVHCSLWLERRECRQRWDGRIRAVVAVHVRATGREVGQFGPSDVRQVAAATGCSLDDARFCLDELTRQAGVPSRRAD
jgi:hypothetical protein